MQGAFAPVTGAAVPAPELIQEAQPRKPDVAGFAPRQETLFGPSKVIPFELLGAPRPAPPRRPDVARRAVSATARISGSAQSALDFQPAAPLHRAVLSREAPIAGNLLRLKSAALDSMVIAIAALLGAAAFYFMGGRFSLNPRTLCGYGGATLVMLLFYHLFWATMGRETPGMRRYRIAILTYDGAPPEPGRRIVRFAAACLSVVALGLGLFWALVDEEGLAWHDHVSETFPAIRVSDDK